MKHVVDEALVERARALGPILREGAPTAEADRRLPRSVVVALERAGLTKLFLPKALGGLETDPVTYLRVIEEIASFDSVAAWLLMASNASTWSGGRFPEKSVEEFFDDPERSIIATAFQPPVMAQEVPGGYQLSGRRPFASGIQSARWLWLSAIVMDGERPRMRHGAPEVIFAVMPAESVQVIDTWYGLGLRGSDSNDVAVENLFVPVARTCPVTPSFEPNRYYRAPLYRLPMLCGIVLANLAPIALAIGRNAIEEVRKLSAQRTPMSSSVPLRDRGSAQARLGQAEAMLRAARTLTYDTMEDVWLRTCAGEPLNLEQRAGILLAATHAAQVGAEVTHAMFTSGGSSAVYAQHPLERLFRDSQVVRQHGFVCSNRYETIAQVMLGLEPDLPFIHL